MSITQAEAGYGPPDFVRAVQEQKGKDAEKMAGP